MTWTLWLTFAAAALALIASPGPTTLLAVSRALSCGRAALWLVLGVVLGDALAMSLSFLGVGAILAASAGLFTALKLAGAAYLLFLAVKAWRAPVGDQGLAAAAPASRGRMIGQAFVVTALNPKGIIFFVAFMPQFLVHDAPLVPQMLLLGGTWLGFAALTTGLYIVLAGQFRDRLARPGTLRWFNRGGAVALAGAGVLTALKRHPA